jgi:branched-chain amino acid transport system ATP-binding protein
MSLLSLAQVHAYYDLSHILHGIDLELGAGEVVALLGRNGAGKTTTIRSINGLLPPADGVIRFNDVDITTWRADAIARAGIATVPEGREIFSTLTVTENLALAARRAGDWTVDRVVDTFPIIKPLMSRLGGRLSGGEQQIVAIARALLLEPKLIMLDEPSQGLAPVMVDQVVDVLLALKAERISMLLVEQKLDIALELSDRIYVLDIGRVVKECKRDELEADPEIAQRHLGVG